MTESTPNAARPIAQIRRGAINGAIWRNTNGKGIYYAVSFERLYRDDSGTWRSSQSFGRDDLLVIARVAAHAFDAICELQQKDRSNDNEGATSPGAESDPEPEPDPRPSSKPPKPAASAAASQVVKRSR